MSAIGPIGSPPPGMFGSVFFVAVATILLVNTVASAIRHARERDFPESSSLARHLFVALVAAFLIVVGLRGVWFNWVGR